MIIRKRIPFIISPGIEAFDKARLEDERTRPMWRRMWRDRNGQPRDFGPSLGLLDCLDEWISRPRLHLKVPSPKKLNRFSVDILNEPSVVADLAGAQSIFIRVLCRVAGTENAGILGLVSA
ncbi:MAG: hypothetical protein M1133_02385 [Armatimonadetes bacterium]|nr:hypothetical protein [Armatimonadota bacterium]